MNQLQLTITTAAILSTIIAQPAQGEEIEQLSYNAADLIVESHSPEDNLNQNNPKNPEAVELVQRGKTSTRQSSGWAISPDVSTLGIGGMVTKSLTPNLNARVGINGFSLGVDVEETDVTYQGNLNLFNVSTLVDLYPFKKSGFHLTGGLVFQNNEVKGTGEASSGTITIGGQNFNAADLGSVDAEVSFSNSIAPYLGIGWGNAVKPGRRLGFSLNLGVMFAGSPEVSLTPNFGPAVIPAIQDQINQAIATEQQELEDDIDQFNIYPVLSLSLSYQF